MARHKSSNGAGVLVDAQHWNRKGAESEPGKRLRGQAAIQMARHHTFNRR